MHTRTVIHHPEMGIYLGVSIGLGFWSLLDPVGQKAAVTFCSEREAREHVASWDSSVEGLTFPSIRAADPFYATIEEIEAAGLPGWDPDQSSAGYRAFPVRE